jgi:ATP-GRASP peptide maturase of grasp-with-spasm system
MVLIISTTGGSVNSVIDWITSKGITVHRLNSNVENVRLREISLTSSRSDVEITFEDYNITTRLSDYSGIWVWHGDIRFNNCKVRLISDEMEELTEMIIKSLDKHQKILLSYINSFLINHPERIIGNVSIQNLNKLEVLLKAKRSGLEIPETFIVTKKTDLLRLKNFHPLITKPYHEVSFPIFDNRPHQNYTVELTDTFLESINDEDIFPTMVQEKIEKLFEIRSFFLKDTFYSMAIFSQMSAQTVLDFRDYDLDKPNRTVPFNLPLKIEERLKRLFKALNLDSGSIDMIYTIDNKFKFLEINPVGQFGMVSFPCNYYLEELLMQKLTHERTK